MSSVFTPKGAYIKGDYGLGLDAGGGICRRQRETRFCTT